METRSVSFKFHNIVQYNPLSLTLWTRAWYKRAICSLQMLLEVVPKQRPTGVTFSAEDTRARFAKWY